MLFSIQINAIDVYTGQPWKRRKNLNSTQFFLRKLNRHLSTQKMEKLGKIAWESGNNLPSLWGLTKLEILH